MARRRLVAVLGGTFDRLHAGHKSLLRAAFSVGDRVAIGLTSDQYLQTHPKRWRSRIRPFAARRRDLVAFVTRSFPGRKWSVVPLHDPFGGSVQPGVDVLVASVESRAGARRVNRERARRGLGPVRLLLVPVVRGEDLLPVSSTRVRAGDISTDGRRTSPIRVEVRGRVNAAGKREIRTTLRRILPVRTPLVLRFRPSSGAMLPRGSDGVPPRGPEYVIRVATPKSPGEPARIELSEGPVPSPTVSGERPVHGSIAEQLRRQFRPRLRAWEKGRSSS